MLTTDTRAQGGRRDVRRRRGDRDRRRHGQGRGDALARDGDDARGAHHRRARRARGRCAAPSPTRSAELRPARASTGAAAPTTPSLVLASGAAGGPSIDADRAASRALTDALGEVCASLAEQMARDAEGRDQVRAHRRHRRAFRRRRRDRGTGDRGIASSCSARSTAAIPTGAACCRRSARAVRICDPERVDIAYGGVTVCRDGIACAHDAAALARGDGRAPTSPCTPSCTSAHGEATVLTTDLSPAYIAENMRTS